MSEQLTARRKALSVAATTLILASCAGKETAAEPAPNPHGNDVSFPQCGKELPTDQAYGIVGLNGTLANNFNDCFKEQIAWAKASRGGSSQPKAAIYVHVGNPGSKQASSWPEVGSNRYGECHGDDSLACDYEYGAQLAKADMAEAAKYDAVGLMTWLDVEPNYSWQRDKARNVATMEGMTKAFTDAGSPVGIYSSHEIWQQLAGDVSTSSELHNLPNWLLGLQTEAEAQKACGTEGFTGKVVVAQVADNISIDRDIAC